MLKESTNAKTFPQYQAYHTSNVKYQTLKMPER
jgi:hypothetical protein